MKKALKITGAILLVLLLLLFVTPFIFRDRIEQEVKKLANRTLKSELNFSGMSLSFFSHFPNLCLTLNDFSLRSAPPFKQDTLIKAHEISFGVNVNSLFGKTIVITRIYFDKAQVNIGYNEKGDASFDVYKSDTTASAGGTAAQGGAELSIEKIFFRNCRVIYSDASIPVRVVADGLDYSGKSDMSKDIFSLNSEVKIKSLDAVYDRMKILDGKPVTAKLSTKVNTRNLSVDFEKNDLKIKDIPLEFHGKFSFEKEGYRVTLNFLSVLEKEFLSARFRIVQGKTLWISAKMNASVDIAKWVRALDVKSVDIRGLYDLNLTAEGSYATGPVRRKGLRNEVDTVIVSIPKFSLMTKFSNGYFKYASLPQPLTNIAFQLNADCPDSDYHHISVKLETLKASFLKNQFEGYFRMKSLHDAPVEAGLKGSINLSELKQVIPLDSITLAGILSMDVTVSGNYAPEKKLFPITAAEVSLTGGSLLTKYYPNPISEIGMKMKVIDHGGTMKDLAVSIDPLNFSFEGKPFTLKASLSNFDDLSYDLQSKGVIDLARVYQVFSRKGMDLKGYLEADLSLRGRQSDAIAGRIDKLNNKGTLKLRDIALSSEDYPKPFIIRTGNFRFDQDKVWFDNFLANYGSSDFLLKGYIRNTIQYALNQGGTLTGDFELKSNHLNVDEFMVFAGEEPDAATSATTPAPGVVIIPRDLDIGFKANIHETEFKGLKVHDIAGEITMKDGILVLKGGKLNIIDCKVGMEATYGSVNPLKGFFDFHLKAEDFDIKRAYNEIGMIREMAPSAGKAEGIVSLDYSVKGMLNADMFPVLPSLEGGGVFSIKKVKVYGLKLFNDISKGTEKEGLSNPDLSKVDMHSTIKNNTITLEQFKFKVKGIRVRISGTTTFDTRMNLKIRLGMGPFGIIGIPMKVTGTMENVKIRYGKGTETDDLKESDYTDQLPKEMLDRIKNAKEDNSDSPDTP